MKKQNPQSEAHDFRKKLTPRLESGKQAKRHKSLKEFEFFGPVYPLIELPKPTMEELRKRQPGLRIKVQDHEYGKFLCEKLSLRQVLKMASEMVLDESERDVNREQALLVKQSIENSSSADTSKERAKQLAFIAGMRWMQIIWSMAMKGQGAPTKPLWRNVEQNFKANRNLSAGQIWRKVGSPGEWLSFKRQFSRRRKDW
jgi:hypothetical protein